MSNATLQAAYFILGIRAAGLAAGPMGGFDHDAVTKEFFPGGNHKAFMVINIGKPAAATRDPAIRAFFSTKSSPSTSPQPGTNPLSLPGKREFAG